VVTAKTGCSYVTVTTVDNAATVTATTPGVARSGLLDVNEGDGRSLCLRTPQLGPVPGDMLHQIVLGIRQHLVETIETTEQLGAEPDRPLRQRHLERAQPLVVLVLRGRRPP
jgi:hypothetical protein